MQNPHCLLCPVLLVIALCGSKVIAFLSNFSLSNKLKYSQKESKHLKGRLGPRVSNVTFFNHEGRLGPRISNVTFLIMKVGWGPALVT